jgi:hypothetical protein
MSNKRVVISACAGDLSAQGKSPSCVVAKDWTASIYLSKTTAAPTFCKIPSTFWINIRDLDCPQGKTCGFVAALY